MVQCFNFQNLSFLTNKLAIHNALSKKHLSVFLLKYLRIQGQSWQIRYILLISSANISPTKNSIFLFKRETRAAPPIITSNFRLLICACARGIVEYFINH